MEKLWKILKFKLNGGYSCKHCGTKMFFNHVQLNDNKEHDFLFENHTHNMCTSCTQYDIDFHAETVFTEDDKCDWCGTSTEKTCTWIYHNKTLDSEIIFGQHWWNGAHICQDCMHDKIESNKGSETSSIFRINGDKYYAVNNLGMLKYD